MQITGRTRLGCLIGSPVSHSISPMMYNEAFRLLDIDNVYLCFDTAGRNLGSVVEALKNLNVFGFNVTMPHKEEILPYLDEVSDTAKMIGAVNTVKNENGRLVGYNTDGIGFVRSLETTGFSFENIEMTLLGAGGAASSIAVQSALSGVSSLHILNRKSGHSFPNAVRLSEMINKNTGCKCDAADLNDRDTVFKDIEKSTLLVNATSVGMAPDTESLPLTDLSCLHPDLTVMDIIYNPKKTLLLKEAEKKGCSTSNGLYMLLYQGEAAFHIFTGETFPTEQIREKFF